MPWNRKYAWHTHTHLRTVKQQNKQTEKQAHKQMPGRRMTSPTVVVVAAAAALVQHYLGIPLLWWGL